VGGVTGVSLGGLGVSVTLCSVAVGIRLVAVLLGVIVGVSDGQTQDSVGVGVSVTQGLRVSSPPTGHAG
jgi:hypothetical protein